MHAKQDRDGSDRQRNEVKGMKKDGKEVDMHNGETWKITYKMFIPDSLLATKSFTHIMQVKNPGSGFSPIYVMSLRRHGDDERIEAKIFSGDGDNNQNIKVGETELAPLRNKWIDVEMEMKVSNKGYVRWALHDNGKKIVEGKKNGDTFIKDRNRPKWGIYRSLNDPSHLKDTHMFLKDMKAYKLN